MNREDRIAELKAELAKLENEPIRANDIGAIALKKISDELDRIKVNAKNINLERQSENEIMTELKQINYSSWTALKALEQDITERN